MVNRRSWLAALLLAGCFLEGVAPLPHDDRASTVEDTEVVIDVLGNDYGDHDFVSISTDHGWFVPTVGNSEPAASTGHGQVQVRDDGTLLYTPTLDFHGEDQFFYVVGYRGATARARVTVEVAPDSEQFGDLVVLYGGDYAMVALAAEFGGTGGPDLVVQDGNRVVALARGEGLALNVAQVYGDTGCCAPKSMVVADFDGNGQSDLVYFGKQHSLELHFAQPSEGATGVRFDAHPIDYYGPNAIEFDGDPGLAQPERGAAGDFDGDGELDLAVGLDSAPGIIVHLGLGSGAPRASRVFETGGIAAIASGDLHGDGVQDVVALTNHGSIVWIRADRASPHGFAMRIQGVGSSNFSLGVGDIDGRPGDEVVLPGRDEVTVLRAVGYSSGPGLEQLRSTAPGLLFGSTLADIDGDGRADLLGTPQAPHGLELWRATERAGAPAFDFAADFALTHPDYTPLVVDFNGDGALDVIVSRAVPLEKRSELVLLPGR